MVSSGHHRFSKLRLYSALGTWSSGLIRSDHAQADQPRDCREKKTEPFCRIVRRMVHFLWSEVILLFQV
ncbi:unnamed protein product [Tenebrio molitor]|nr:unnamed protein product [Tenebrio molitor]